MGGLVPWDYILVMVPGGDRLDMGYFSPEEGAFSSKRVQVLVSLECWHAL